MIHFLTLSTSSAHPGIVEFISTRDGCFMDVSDGFEEYHMRTVYLADEALYNHVRRCGDSLTFECGMLSSLESDNANPAAA